MCLHSVQRTPAGQQSNSNKNDHNRTLYNMVSISSSSLFGNDIAAQWREGPSCTVNKWVGFFFIFHHKEIEQQMYRASPPMSTQQPSRAYERCHKYFCPKNRRGEADHEWKRSYLSHTLTARKKNDFTVVFFPVYFLFDFLTLRIEPYTTRVHVESMINDSKRASGLLFFFGKEKERRLEHRFPVYRKDIHSRKRERKKTRVGL